jgi:hypothetical protein
MTPTIKGQVWARTFSIAGFPMCLLALTTQARADHATFATICLWPPPPKVLRLAKYSTGGPEGVKPSGAGHRASGQGINSEASP